MIMLQCLTTILPNPASNTPAAFVSFSYALTTAALRRFLSRSPSEGAFDPVLKVIPVGKPITLCNSVVDTWNSGTDATPVKLSSNTYTFAHAPPNVSPALRSHTHRPASLRPPTKLENFISSWLKKEIVNMGRLLVY